MKFGLFINNQQPRDTDPVLSFRQCVQQVIAARDSGFDAIASGHHYVSPPFIALQNLPFLARLAADSGEMDLVLAVTLLALLNPVQTAEEIATLDVMSGGRVVFGVGIGYREEEFQAFGLQVADRVPRMLEGLRLIKRLWSEDGVTHQGLYFNRMPVQAGFWTQKIYMAANVSGWSASKACQFSRFTAAASSGKRRR